ncbi:MAG TPA: hypothetical protein VG148_07145 [Pyrinomonadaceae bacterium]|nr:hypothetical protein [Pyrinomonadaceae bacterium]
MQRLSNRLALALALAAVCLGAGGARAQETKQTPAAEDNYVREKGFASEVFEIRNRDPLKLTSVLLPLASGFRGSAVTPNAEFGTISVRDFPENIHAIREAIRRLDTPEPPRPGIEFHVHLLVGADDGRAARELPAGLGEVVSQLRAALGHKNFSVMGSQVLRGKEGRGDVYNKGVADLGLADAAAVSGYPVFYEYHLRSFSLDHAAGPARVQVEDFSMSLRVPLVLTPNNVTYQDVGFRNPVALREGERVVVGTTSVGDKSLVVVLSATTMK